MSRCPRTSDPDIIHVSYRTYSNRSTRLLLLEMAVEEMMKAHGTCACKACELVTAALKLKGDPPWKKESKPTAA